MRVGTVTIGTELDTSKFDKQIESLDKKIKKQERNIDVKATASMSADEDLAKKRAEIQNIKDQYQRATDLQTKIYKAKATEGQRFEFNDIMAQYGSFDKMTANLEKAGIEEKKLQENAQKLDNSYKNAVQDLEEMRVKKAQLEAQRTFEKQKNDVMLLRDNIDGVGNSLNKAFQKAGKLAIGIFGLRTAFVAVRQASSTLAQYDQQYADNIEYIKFALATSIQPILEGIVQLAYKALQFIQMIVYIFTGKDIFANASTDKFNNKLKDANKSAKDLKKTLAGFDEMNVLNDNTKGSGSSTKTPSIDLSFTLPDWLKGDSFWERAVKASNHFFGGLWENVRNTEKEIQERLVDTSAYRDMYNEWGLMYEGIDRFALGALQTFDGVFTGIGGLIEMLVGLFTGNTDLMADGWNSFCNGLFKAFEGIGNAILGALEFVVGTIQGIIVGAGNWLNDNLFKPIGQWFSDIWNNIKTGAENCWKGVQSAFQGIGDFFYGIWQAIVGFFQNIGITVSNWFRDTIRNVANGILSMAENIVNGGVNLVNGLIWLINQIPGVNISKLNNVQFPRLATGGIINMPNKGVNVGGAIAGESGREGVIPLTDSQAMETLGEAIGRYITINANIVNTMNGRVISRELQQIQNDRNFAYNR